MRMALWTKVGWKSLLTLTVADNSIIINHCWRWSMTWMQFSSKPTKDQKLFSHWHIIVRAHTLHWFAVNNRSNSSKISCWAIIAKTSSLLLFHSTWVKNSHHQPQLFCLTYQKLLKYLMKYLQKHLNLAKPSSKFFWNATKSIFKSWPKRCQLSALSWLSLTTNSLESMTNWEKSLTRVTIWIELLFMHMGLISKPMEIFLWKKYLELKWSMSKN